jgi:hypothetical protein
LRRLLEKIEITPYRAPTIEFCCEKWIDENAPILQIFALKFENKFLRDGAHRPVLQPSSAHANSVTAAAPRKPLPALPVHTVPPHAAHAPLHPLHVHAPAPIAEGNPLSNIPTTKAECLAVFESGDVNALTNMFGHARIDLLASSFTIAQEKEVVDRLRVPVMKTAHQNEAEFLNAIQAYIRNNPNSFVPSAFSNVVCNDDSAISSIAAPLHSSSCTAAASLCPPCSGSSVLSHHLAANSSSHGSGRKDKVRAQEFLKFNEYNVI